MKTFHPDQLDPVLWDVMSKIGGDKSRLEDATAGLNRGALNRLGWALERAGTALTAERFGSHTDPDLDDAERQALGEWVVAQGRERYYDVWDHPEKIPPRPPTGDPGLGVLGRLWSIFEARYGVLMPPLPADM